MTGLTGRACRVGADSRAGAGSGADSLAGTTPMFTDTGWVAILPCKYKNKCRILFLFLLGQYLGQDLQIPEPPNKTEGDIVVFAPDNPPPSTSIFITQWFFATTPIITVVSGVATVTPAYEGRVSFDNNTLALTLLSDSGIYGLTVITSAGGALTGETSLQVFEPYVRLIGPEDPLIEGDSSANIISEGTGIITSVQWMKDNSPLSPSNSIIFSPDNRSVSISPVQRSDSGKYQCTYTNPVSSGTATYSLIINYGPEDVSIKGPDVVDLGVRVSLSCSANSEPSASFRWTFNGTDTGVTTDTFTIDETDFTHSGDYDCTAWNSVTNRSASQRHALLVKGPAEGSMTVGSLFREIVIIVKTAAFAAPTVILLQIICARRAGRKDSHRPEDIEMPTTVLE
ncbi:carcinoembryonic antigen-related cell adhesion molecule 20-like [Ctenopharyngodon idella]|uniref:carcinoembryonic antigen-related cell adhesion molecule 20-like n=1 Tax=Ctenopharyngodon idella TaxID=7959 RepID=UPI00222F23C9|nr:carcinoembryonic antigen-related cell adhesion molecule 20-like [Ctenopharyngodon idella]